METAEAGGSCHGLAWSIYGVNATSQHTTTGTAGQAGRAPDGCLHDHYGKATSAVWCHRSEQRQTNDAVRCDTEGMAEQADVLRASSQGKSAVSTVRGRWRCERGTWCTYGQARQGKVRQSWSAA